MICRCTRCDRCFTADDDTDECPPCQQIAERRYVVPRHDVETPMPWSKAAMRERLSVSGDVDE
jgi:hypothetical protein